MSNAEWLSLVVIRRADGHRFDARRAHIDPDDHRALTTHLRAIARAVDHLPESHDDWLSDYEIEVSLPRSDTPLFILSARGQEE